MGIGFAVAFCNGLRHDQQDLKEHEGFAVDARSPSIDLFRTRKEKGQPAMSALTASMPGKPTVSYTAGITVDSMS